MSTAMPFSHYDSNSSASLSTFSNSSFCLSTACTDSPLTDPNHFSKPARSSGGGEPHCLPRNLQEPDKSVYSFAWSLSYSDHLEADAAIDRSNDMSDSQQLQENIPKPLPGRSEKRFQVPNLPPPIFWSTVANPDIFSDYIDAKQLLPHDRTIPPPAKPGPGSANPRPGSVKLATDPVKPNSAKPASVKLSSAKPASVKPATNVKPSIIAQYHSEAVGKPLTNMKAIVKANTDDRKVRKDIRPTDSWIHDHFRNPVLPAPFHPELLTDPDPSTDPGADKLWQKSPLGRTEDNFVGLPNILCEKETSRWLLHYARNIGKLSLTVSQLHF